AHASRNRLLSLETVENRLERLEQELAQAEPAPDATAALGLPSVEEPLAPDPAAPGPLASPGHEPAPPSFLGKTVRGQKRQRAQYRRAREILRQRHRANRRRRKDKQKKDARIVLAIGDPVAPLGLDKLGTYRPLYNVQTMSDVGTDLVLAYATIPSTTDSGQLVTMIDQTHQITGRRLNEVLVDAGYPSGPELAQCAQRGVTVFAPWNENAFTAAKRAQAGSDEQIPKDQFTFDPTIPGYRCPEGAVLRYRTRTSKQKANGDYVPLEVYQADPSDCGCCPRQARCVRSGSGAPRVRRPENQGVVEGMKQRVKTPQGKEENPPPACTRGTRVGDLNRHL